MPGGEQMSNIASSAEMSSGPSDQQRPFPIKFPGPDLRWVVEEKQGIALHKLHPHHAALQQPGVAMGRRQGGALLTTGPRSGGGGGGVRGPSGRKGKMLRSKTCHR